MHAEEEAKNLKNMFCTMMKVTAFFKEILMKNYPQENKKLNPFA